MKRNILLLRNSLLRASIFGNASLRFVCIFYPALLVATFINTFSFGQGIQTISSNGTFTVPAGVTSITVQAWGAVAEEVQELQMVEVEEAEVVLM